MQTASVRRARRKGRPRKSTAKRHECGKVVQPKAPELEEAVLSVALTARMRRGLAKTLDAARDQRLGYSLGRAWCDGAIDEHLHETGLELARRYARQIRAIDAPSPNPRIAALNTSGGEPPEVTPYQAQRWRQQWQEVFEALKTVNRAAAQEVLSVSVFDRPVASAKNLKAGLKKLTIALDL